MDASRRNWPTMPLESWSGCLRKMHPQPRRPLTTLGPPNPLLNVRDQGRKSYSAIGQFARGTFSNLSPERHNDRPTKVEYASLDNEILLQNKYVVKRYYIMSPVVVLGFPKSSRLGSPSKA